MPGKRILVTGGSGFVGQNLCEYLKQHMVGEACEIVRFRSNVCDLTLPTAAEATIKVAEPEVVIHLAAACGGIGANLLNPATFWRDNLLMGINVIEACAKFRVRHLISFGTVCSYGQNAQVPFDENMLFTEWPEVTNRPYGVAKLALLEGLRAYAIQHELRSTYLIPTNLYGPYDNFNLDSSHVIPAMIRKMHEAVIHNQPKVQFWGDGSPTRDFLYVEDLCRAVLLAIKKPVDGAINLGGGQEINMRALAEAVGAVVGFQGEIEWDPGMPNGQQRRLVDYRRATLTLGWEPCVDLVTGLGETYRWFLRKDLQEAS